MEDRPSSDLIFMHEALEEAKKAFAEKEVPIGAVIVHDAKIIARGYNRVEKDKSVLGHAELVCLQEAARILGDWRLPETTLYTTLEPCPMCAGAILLSRVQRVVWGADDPRQGAGGSFSNLLISPYPFHTLKVSKGILAEESAHLLREFFRQRRKGIVDTALESSQDQDV